MRSPIPARSPYLVLIKRTCHQVNFTVAADQRLEIKESEKRAEKAVEHNGDDDTSNC